jgi:FMN phosphatase YigB (HAD superfamily)
VRILEIDRNQNIRALIFDWGDTIMRDFPEKSWSMYTWDHVEYIPGAQKTLEKIYQKYIMVIATNAGASDTKDMIKALERVGAEKYFQYFFSSKDLGYEKPDVRFFTSISKHIEVPPENCMMIGNIYEKDIIGAKACGMFTVFFNEKKSEALYPDADIVIQSFDELAEILDCN